MIYEINTQEKFKNLKVEELYQNITKISIDDKRKYLIFYLIAIKDGNEVNMPRIKYHIKNEI